MIPLTNEYFANQRSDGKIEVYQFGEMCEPVKVQLCTNLYEAQCWANKVKYIRKVK